MANERTLRQHERLNALPPCPINVTAARVDDDTISDSDSEAMMAAHEKGVLDKIKLRVHPLGVTRLAYRPPTPAQRRETPVELAGSTALIELEHRRAQVLCMQRRELGRERPAAVEARVHAEEALLSRETRTLLYQRRGGIGWGAVARWHRMGLESFGIYRDTAVLLLLPINLLLMDPW